MFTASRIARLAALALGYVCLSITTTHAAAPCDGKVVCVSPGRVAFAVAPNGSWKFFGPTNEGSFIEKGGVVVYAQAESGAETELMNGSGGARALLSAPIEPVKEGARGGARDPFPRPDDDYDGNIDEDPLDRVDNDNDGRVDEDFAAIGDEMAVALYGPKNGVVEVRQELYAWSLPHVDGMVATAVSVRATNATLEGVRVGFLVEPAGDFQREAAPLIEVDRLDVTTRRAAGETLVWRDGSRGMAMLVWAPSTGSEDWEIREDRKGTRFLSPSLGRVSPDVPTTIYAALIALPPDDLRSARAIQAALRTLAGTKRARLIPPPVALTKPEESAPSSEGATIGAPYGDITTAQQFWNTAGKIDPSLLVGSPNPFRDTIAIDYEVPERVVDEEGVEHQLSGEVVETSVKVYNVTGRLVATLVESPHAPGHYRTGWSAQDEQGEQLASGVYYVKLTIGKRSVTQRMVQLK
jgi:FlgD Ig-like domain